MELRETIKKSTMAANGEYDIHKLCYPREGLLNCKIEEEKEELTFSFDLGRKNPFLNLRKENKQDKLSALIDVTKLHEIYQEYYFELKDSNLYYDRNCRVYVKNRDIYERGITSDQESFLTSYKALIGFVMQNRFTFADYLEGGLELLKKNKFLETVYECETLEEIKEYLEKAYEEIVETIKNKKVLVDKSWHRSSRGCLIACLLIILAAAIYLGFLQIQLLPRKDAIMKANNAYLDANYIQVIDSLEGIDIAYLDKYQTYILAVSYIKSENLTPAQKENVLEQVGIDGNEKIKQYWIYLGRLSVEEAINIALQNSDDELLLYAYLTKKTMVEKNTEMQGEEKTQILSELEQKINELAKKYGKEE